MHQAEDWRLEINKTWAPKPGVGGGEQPGERGRQADKPFQLRVHVPHPEVHEKRVPVFARCFLGKLFAQSW